MGIHRAMEAAGLAHRIVGFDVVPQPRYPFEFVQQDALTVDLSRFDAVWASPPCQAYIRAGIKHRDDGKLYPDLVAPTREMLEASGLPWAMENVMGAPMERQLVLCGLMFDLPLFRHRLFEASHLLLSPAHRSHRGLRVGDGIYSVAGWTGWLGTWQPGEVVWNGGIADWRIAMGIDWMRRGELTQAVPPAYAEFVWRQIISAISQRR